MDDIKAECIFNEQVHVKEEEDSIKEEPEWEDNAGVHGISSAAAQAGLYANQEVKHELELVPVGLQPPDIGFTVYAGQTLAAGEQPVPRDCVKLERSDDLDDTRRAEIHKSHVEHADVGHGINSSVGGARGDDALAGAGGQEERRGQTHTGHSYSCATCNKNFMRLGSLKTHERTHTGEKPFSCEICNKKFTQLGNLKTHERTHTGERPFSCGICQQKFTQLSHLKTHKRIHTGERVFSCGVCQQNFTSSSYLKAHGRIHTGDKPYSCGVCRKAFTQSCDLRRHERTHTGERPYSCGICDNKFTQLNSLKAHERIDTGEKPFSCGICKKKFAHSNTLKNHERTHEKTIL